MLRICDENHTVIIRKRSDLQKHFTMKNCDRTFHRNILRFKNNIPKLQVIDKQKVS